MGLSLGGSGSGGCGGKGRKLEEVSKGCLVSWSVIKSGVVSDQHDGRVVGDRGRRRFPGIPRGISLLFLLATALIVFVAVARAVCLKPTD